MLKVLVAGKLHPAGRQILDSAVDVATHYIDDISEPTYAPHIEDIDALLIRTQPMSAATVAKAQNLKIVSRHGVGYDAIDLDALNARQIPLAICGDVNSTAVAEHAAMMLLAASKRAVRADSAVRHGLWEWRNQLEAQELCGKNLLLLGYGRIGKRIAKIMHGFSMTIRAHDPFLAKAGWPEGDIASMDSFNDALAWADLISISIPHTGKALLGAEQFGRMKQGVIVVNTARGGILDEQALVEALKSGRVGAVGIDVFETEPFATENPLAQFNQAILSPHIAGLTDGAAERMAISSAQNILDFFSGTLEPDLIVNRTTINS